MCNPLPPVPRLKSKTIHGADEALPFWHAQNSQAISDELGWLIESTLELIGMDSYCQIGFRK
jgi:hypothetical protein